MRKCRKTNVAFVIAAVCLLSLPTAAQQSGPRAVVSDDDFMRLNQQIKELKDPTFRALLRMRLVSWESPESGPVRRQAAMEVATQGITDLCDHQDQVRPATASWLHGSLVKEIKALQSPAEPAIQTCVLKAEPKSAESDLGSAMRMLSNPETSAAGLSLAKSAIESGRVSGETLLGQLLSLKEKHSPHLPEFLNAVLTLEEKQPRTLRLQIMPFFSSLYLDESVAPEIATRFLFVALQSTRLSPEEFTNGITRSSATTLLNSIVAPAQRLAPQLYPEIMGRLRSISSISAGITGDRLVAEERIQKAGDQLEQLITEANSAAYEQLRTHFLARAAKLAKEQGQLSKAVDLEMQMPNAANSAWSNEFLSEIVSLALKKKAPADATYAISKLTQPLAKAGALRLLGEYYGENRDQVKSKEAFAQSAGQLRSVANNNEKINASLLLAESLLKYEPADAYAVFRDAVKAINNLPSPATDNDTVKLLPVAEQLIRSFRLLATRETQTATTLAAEIKLSELRVSALSGAYSSR